jgi:hypothetical protein
VVTKHEGLLVLKGSVGYGFLLLEYDFYLIRQE